MMALIDVLNEVRAKIARYKDTPRLNEQNTKASLIDPVIQALGWNISDIEEVNREFKPPNTNDKPADYALLSHGTPRVLVEAKALGEEASDRRWASQVLGYAVTCGAAWVVLTNGDEYRIYNAHVSVDADDKLLGSVKVSVPESRPEQLLVLLRRDGLSEDQLEVLWKTRFVDGRVQKILSGMFSPAPEPGLVRLIRKRDPKLSGADIRDSLTRMVARFDFSSDGKSRAALTAPALNVTAPGSSEPDEVRLADLISARIVAAPLELTRTYKGQTLTARIEADGTVSCLGKRHPSLSGAGAAARASVIGKRPDGSDPATNGWGFWRFRDANGRMAPIDVLRERFLRTGASHPGVSSRGSGASIATAESPSVSKRNAAYQRFFQSLIDRLREEHQFTNALKAMPQNWYSFTTGVRGFEYGASFANGGRIRTELRIYLGDEPRSKAAFEKLRVDAAAVEREFAEKLDWERMDGRKACRIASYRPASIRDSRETLEEHCAWAIDRLLRFKRVFGERILSLANARK